LLQRVPNIVAARLAGIGYGLAGLARRRFAKASYYYYYY